MSYCQGCGQHLLGAFQAGLVQIQTLFGQQCSVCSAGIFPILGQNMGQARLAKKFFSAI